MGENRYGCNISFKERGFEIAKFHDVKNAKMFLNAYLKRHDDKHIDISLTGRNGDIPK